MSLLTKEDFALLELVMYIDQDVLWAANPKWRVGFLDKYRDKYKGTYKKKKELEAKALECAKEEFSSIIKKKIDEAASEKKELVWLLDSLGLDDNGIGNMIKYQFGNDPNATKRIPKEASVTEDAKATSGAVADIAEWVAVIKGLRENKKLINLKIIDRMVQFKKDSKGNVITLDGGKKAETNVTLALVYASDTNPSQVIVTFKGTSGAWEWVDNFKGLYLDETPIQKEALAFLRGLDADDIELVGHSKGANKAMYCTLLDDRVSKCLGMDGQGFQEEFFKKYSKEISEKSDSIKNISTQADFVHMLLSPLPKVNSFVKGTGIRSTAEFHCPLSIVLEDENGYFVRKEFKHIDEAEGITKLHSVIQFWVNNMDQKEKEQIGTYLGNVAAFGIADDKTFNANFQCDKVSELVLQDKDSLSLLLAYLVLYKDKYGLSKEDLNTILDSLEVRLGGFDPIIRKILPKILDAGAEKLLANEEEKPQKVSLWQYIINYFRSNKWYNQWIGTKATKREIDLFVSVWNMTKQKVKSIHIERGDEDAKVLV